MEKQLFMNINQKRKRFILITILVILSFQNIVYSSENSKDYIFPKVEICNEIFFSIISKEIITEIKDKKGNLNETLITILLFKSDNIYCPIPVNLFIEIDIWNKPTRPLSTILNERIRFMEYLGWNSKIDWSICNIDGISILVFEQTDSGLFKTLHRTEKINFIKYPPEINCNQIRFRYAYNDYGFWLLNTPIWY